jgi:alpha-L-rhamnosidase
VEDDRFVLQVKVLADTTATLHVPSVDLYAITEGGVPLNEAYGVEFLWADESGVVLSVGSGQYEFECRAEQV